MEDGESDQISRVIRYGQCVCVGSLLKWLSRVLAKFGFFKGNAQIGLGEDSRAWLKLDQVKSLCQWLIFCQVVKYCGLFDIKEVN